MSRTLTEGKAEKERERLINRRTQLFALCAKSCAAGVPREMWLRDGRGESIVAAGWERVRACMLRWRVLSDCLDGIAS